MCKNIVFFKKCPRFVNKLFFFFLILNTTNIYAHVFVQTCGPAANAGFIGALYTRGVQTEVPSSFFISWQGSNVEKAGQLCTRQKPKVKSGSNFLALTAGLMAKIPMSMIITPSY